MLVLTKSSRYGRYIVYPLQSLSYQNQYATQPVTQETKDADSSHNIRVTEQITKVVRRQRIKKPQRQPFAKSLFIGKFDLEVMTYPQLDKADLNNIEKACSILENCKDLYKENQQFDYKYLHQLSLKDALGIQAPQLIGGRDLNVTEHCRLNEILSNSNLRYNIFSNEILGIQTLVKYGNDSQKTKYLNKLVQGEMISAFCASETKVTTAKLHGDSWILNGEKQFIINGEAADVYIVFAKDEASVEGSKENFELTAFLVDKNAEGIITGKCEFDGFTSFDVANVSFRNTTVPKENILGGLGQGRPIFSSVLPAYNLSYGPIGSVLHRNLINNICDHFLRVSDTVELHKSEAVTSRVGEILLNAYAIESVTYLTSGLMDLYENQDCELEAAIVKAVSADCNINSTTDAMNLIGAPALLTNHWCSKLHRQAVIQAQINESSDNLKIVIGLLGLQFAGKNIAGDVRRLRNPLFNASFIIKRLWTDRSNENDTPKLDIGVKSYVHPSCIKAADQIEYCVLRLKFATEMLLTRHGPEIVNKHADIIRLADCIITIYTMVAALGRASRSYCIGLQHAEYEMMLAGSICKKGVDKVRGNITELLGGIYESSDQNFRVTSKRLFKFKEYFPVHPLTRNF